MARLRHRKALIFWKVSTSKLYGLFYWPVKYPSKPRHIRATTLFSKSELSLNNKYKENTPKNPHFYPLFRCLFFDFSPLANSWWFFSNVHASAFLIRETKSGRRFARFFPLRIFMGACNQGRKVLEFLLWGRHCRHSFGFSRNNMKGALYHWRN